MYFFIVFFLIIVINIHSLAVQHLAIADVHGIVEFLASV